ncbi:MAG: DUF6498-containing protein [Candidatus Micrarchaeota archaeon]
MKFPISLPDLSNPLSFDAPIKALILANMVPLIGMAFFGWDLGTLLLGYWAESGVIGLYAMLRTLYAPGNLPVKLFFVIFFPFHFGIFMIVHLAFILLFILFMSMPTTGISQATFDAIGGRLIGVGVFVIALLISHGISFKSNYLGKQENEKTTAMAEVAAPYSRIFVMHLTLMVCGFLTALILPLILVFGKSALLLLGIPLILVKTLVDISAHISGHAMYSGNLPKKENPFARI